MKLDSADLKDLGQARKVVATKDNTTIVDGKGEADKIKNRVEQIKREKDLSDSDYDKEKLQERLAKLSGGVAVIKVGAATETEMKEKKDRIEDALNATRAAVEEGVVPGGGLALVVASGMLKKMSENIKPELVGEKIINIAVLEPIKQIANNAGFDGSFVLYGIIEAQKAQNNKNIGFDAATGKFVDMINVGIIDPTKVVRSALENAASAAMMFLTTEAVITDKPSEKHEHEHGGGMGGMNPGMMGM